MYIKKTHVIIILKVLYVFFVRFQIMPFIFVIVDTKFDIFFSAIYTQRFTSLARKNVRQASASRLIK